LGKDRLRLMDKVTAPDKIVTDPVVLSELARQGIDKDYVEFTDYGAMKQGIGPYMKDYKDLKSGRHIAVASGLPMCNRYGHRIELPWKQSNGTFRAQYNLFDAKVEGNGVALVCLADQPNRTRLYDQVAWHPQIFLNGIEVKPIKDVAKLLEVDPTNQNYLHNVLEWDYGICKRRIRIIEGRFRERWIFAKDPQGEIRIKHNQTGDFKLKFGKYKISDDEELVPREAFIDPMFGYPFEVGASATYYPDTNAAGVDGYVADGDNPNTTTWATLIAEPGDGAVDNNADSGIIFSFVSWSTPANRWYGLYRGIAVIDVSDLPTHTIVSAATLSIYGWVKLDDLSCAPTSNIYSAAPASPTGLVAGDFDSLGSAAYCDTPITYANWNIGTPGTSNDFAFNADPGIVAVQAAATGNTVLKLGFRNANYDVAEAEPNYISNKVSYQQGFGSEKGAGYKPKLVITYTTFYPWRIRIGGVTYGVQLVDLT